MKKILMSSVLAMGLMFNGVVSAASDTLIVDVDNYLMATTSEEELGDFVLKYAKRSNPEIKKVVFNGAADEGTRKFEIRLYDDIFVTSHIENARMYGIKVGTSTLKYLNVPLEVKESVYKDNQWHEVGKLKCVGEETFKHEPRIIVKNALNDIINYYTSPNKNFVRGSIFNPDVHKQDRGSIHW